MAVDTYPTFQFAHAVISIHGHNSHFLSPKLLSLSNLWTMLFKLLPIFVPISLAAFRDSIKFFSEISSFEITSSPLTKKIKD